jgi:chorismate synthase
MFRLTDLEIGGIEFNSFDPEQQRRKDIEKGSLGGALRLILSGVPAGLGSNTQWYDRLDANLARAFFDSFCKRCLLR